MSENTKYMKAYIFFTNGLWTSLGTGRVILLIFGTGPNQTVAGIEWGGASAQKAIHVVHYAWINTQLYFIL